MNPLTQFKKIPILPLLIALSLVVVASAFATPQSGVTTEIIVGTNGPIACGGAPAQLGPSRFDEIDVSVKYGEWKARINTDGASDGWVVRNTFAAGGTTGWHTHPGPSLIMVVSGTITAYEGDDPTCTPHRYTAGTGFVDQGGGHVHLLRNETSASAVTVATQLIPAGLPRRIDAPNPGYCPNIN